MKSAKLFCIGCALFGAASAALAQNPPALYSFEDVYRLAVAGPVAAGGALVPAELPEPALRPAAVVVQAPASAEPHFTVEPLPGPKGWLLLLAGVAAAGWVAHRRLAQL
jgi:hypothetical protein